MELPQKAKDTRPPKDAPKPDKALPVTGVSQFLGRVLEQLSLSSWLPAAMLVGNATLLLQLRARVSLDVGKAVTALPESPLGILVTLLFALILATIVMQAFEFEAIRLLEGYFSAQRGPSLMQTRPSHRTSRQTLGT